MVVFAFLLGLIAVGSMAGDRQETTRMQACVQAGGSWAVDDDNDYQYECIR